MECVSCNGVGCKECNKTGEINIDICPLLLIDHETDLFIQYARMCLDHGFPPVNGGALDQTVAFMDGCDFIRTEIQSWKQELGFFNG